MHTNIEQTHFDDLRRLDAQAVRDSVELLHELEAGELSRATPCSAWTLGDLLAHMTAQHRGFAAAAVGQGQQLTHWTVRPLGKEAVTRYADSAELVIAAFATVETPGATFTLPKFTPSQTFPAGRAVGFHLIDYLVHSWDVARSLDLTYDPDPELLEAALPIALAVPDGPSRTSPRSAFRPRLPVPAGAGALERILALLGRAPDWRRPAVHAAGPA
jgi:uncharacterized protein (TIGR03086 family)